MATDTNLQLGTALVLWDLQTLYPAVDGPEIGRDMSRCQQLAEKGRPVNI